MAKDAAMFFAAEQGIASARCYQWNEAWVTLGRFQIPEEALLKESAVPWSTRPTGGLGVLHGHDLTFALAFPIVHLSKGARSLRTIYRAIASPIIAAFQDVGIPAALGESLRVHGQKGIADCFAAAAPNDVVDPRSGLKICGCAMRASRTAVLLQASIPLGLPLIEPRKIFTGPIIEPHLTKLDGDFTSALVRQADRYLASVISKQNSPGELLAEAIQILS